MNTQVVTIAAVFACAIALAVPLGHLFKIRPKSEGIIHIDGMRAIAALMVVCSHFITHAGLIMGVQTSSALRNSLGAVGVQIFFSITGFLFMRQAFKGPIDVSKLLASRVRRIVPLYLVAMTAAIIVAIHIITAAHQAAPIRYADILNAYTYGFFPSVPPSVAGMSIAGQAGQMWTLAWEWRFYIIVPFLGALAPRRTWAALSLALAVGYAFVDQSNGSLSPWAFFLPGILCAAIEKRVERAALGSRTQIVMTVLGIAAFALALTLDRPVNSAEQTVLCLLGFPCLLFGHRKMLSIKPLRLLGEVSYSIYMWHLVVASLFWVYVQSADHYLFYQKSLQKVPLALIFLAGMIVLSFASYALIERPFLSAGKQKKAAGYAQPQPPLSPT